MSPLRGLTTEYFRATGPDLLVRFARWRRRRYVTERTVLRTDGPYIAYRLSWRVLARLLAAVRYSWCLTSSA